MQQSVSTRRVVVAHVADPTGPATEHERGSLLGFVTHVAALLGHDDGGLHDPTRRHAARPLFVPDNTLTSAEAGALGIGGLDDVFGGVVPHAFVGTKAITHPLVRPGAAAVQGWNDDFAGRVQGLVLDGFTIFDPGDAREAGARLLALGRVRVKSVQARGGLGQSVASDAASLEAMLARIDAADMAVHGLVLEQDLGEVATFSVGQVQVGSMTASYFGTQRQTRNNRGHSVYGGSDLDVVRGGFGELLAVASRPELRKAVEHAMQFHEAAQACYAGLYASRINYDVLLGHDAAGQLRCAVLEQSWRVGGATGPEIAALEAFRADPGRRRVRASCFEVFGDSPAPPADAVVYYRGVDPQAGPMTKYTLLQPDDHPR